MGEHEVNCTVLVDEKRKEQAERAVITFFDEALEDYEDVVLGLKTINKVTTEGRRNIVEVTLVVEGNNFNEAKESSLRYLNEVREYIGGLVIGFK